MFNPDDLRHQGPQGTGLMDRARDDRFGPGSAPTEPFFVVDRTSAPPGTALTEQPSQSMQQNPLPPANREAMDHSSFSPFSASTQQVQSDQLMSSHLNSLLDADSPLMRRAAQQGRDFAASRGLGNSSIAAGNAMGAAMDRAMPIAQFDAARFGNVADQNMNALNQGGMFNSQMEFNRAQLSQQDRQFLDQLGLSRDQFAEQMRQFNLNFGEGRRQFDATYGLNRDQFEQAVRQFGMNFEEGRRQFEATLGFNYDQLDANQQNFLASLGLDRERFEEAQRQFNVTTEQQAEQFAANYGLERDRLEMAGRQFDMNLRETMRQFEATLGLNYEQLSQRQFEFLETLGLDRERFEAAKDQFDRQMAEQGRQFDVNAWMNQTQFNANLAFQNQQLAMQAFAMQQQTLAPIITALNMNEQFMQLDAATQQAVMNNIVNNVFPGMSNAAWANIPQGLVSQQGIWWGQHMPGMPPIFGNQPWWPQPNFNVPSPPGTQPPGEQPPGTQPPGTQPPGTQPPGTQPPPVAGVPPGTGIDPPADVTQPNQTPGWIQALIDEAMANAQGPAGIP